MLTRKVKASFSEFSLVGKFQSHYYDDLDVEEMFQKIVETIGKEVYGEDETVLTDFDKEKLMFESVAASVREFIAQIGLNGSMEMMSMSLSVGKSKVKWRSDG